MTPRARRVRVKAFAKINLTLSVLGTRSDGYHTLETTFQSIALHDTLTFTERDGPFEIACNDPACPLDESNLVWRAAERLRKAAGRRARLSGLHVKIVKRVPAQAGLGGGSSDAAATLRALAAMWRLDIGASRIRKIASALGADVPFFLDGGTALGVGRGDELHALPDVSPFRVVVVVPSFGVSTVAAYKWWDSDNRRRPDSSSANDLQGPVARRRPEIDRLIRKLDRAGAGFTAMSGSGSAVFGLFDGVAAAKRAANLLAGGSHQVFLTRTLTRAASARMSAPFTP